MSGPTPRFYPIQKWNESYFPNQSHYLTPIKTIINSNGVAPFVCLLSRNKKKKFIPQENKVCSGRWRYFWKMYGHANYESHPDIYHLLFHTISHIVHKYCEHFSHTLAILTLLMLLPSMKYFWKIIVLWSPLD